MSAAVLEARLGARRAELEQARARERTAGTVAVGAFFAGIVAAVLRVDATLGVPGVLALLIWIAGLVALMIWRERRTRARRRLDFAVDFLERGLQRLDDVWEFGQDDGSEYADASHPYASDLDLFGPHSLFARLNACATPLGRDALAAHLRSRDPVEDLVPRQEAVRELIEELDFREEMAVELRGFGQLAGEDPERQRELDEATRWLPAWGDAGSDAQVDVLGGPAVHLALGLLASASVGVAIFTPVGWPAIVPFYFLNLFLLQKAKDLETIEEQIHRVRRTLRSWTTVLRRIESKEFASAELRACTQELRDEAVPASAAIQRLAQVFHRFSQRSNAAWQLSFGILWLWDLHQRRGILAWQKQHGPRLRAWLDGAARVEAWSAMADYAAALPEHAWPSLAPEGPVFAAEDLGHPLLPREERIGNDLEMTHAGQVLLVTGSNMSGKSTFLRSVGLAVAMARMGLPVAARSLRMQRLDAVSSMRVQDDLHRGASRFQAEVERLRFCLDRAEEVDAGHTMVVLLDEILAGTNSRDRHAGTVAVLEHLRRLRAITMISTHDLALAELAEAQEERVRMVHFRDHVRNDRMEFDYRLRPGRLPEANALRVLRAAGLEIPDREPGLQ